MTEQTQSRSSNSDEMKQMFQSDLSTNYDELYSNYKEPWVHIPNGKELEMWGKEHEIIYNQTHRQLEKYRLYINAFDMLNENKVSGDYFEFGCHRVRTFRMALTEARRHCMEKMRFFAYDSFEGLPDNDESHGIGKKWVRGNLSTSVEAFQSIIDQHGIYTDQVEIVKGFYNKSLTLELKQQFIERNIKAALITVDCDLYESAVPVFQFIEPFLQEGTIIYIDDWFAGYKGSPCQGVSCAFNEFIETSDYHFADFLSVGWFGRSFIAYKK